ncbi:MAG: TRAP transporter substrate-binding protein [Burkholderiales bacterium]|nr:TRAP transporter substrate-binding protein [Burkholderiales bacterium]
MKLPTRLAVAAAIAVALTGPASAQTTLNISSWIAPQAPFVQNVLLVWAKQVEEATGGRVKTRLLPKAVTTAFQHYDAVKDGLADVTWVVHGYTPGRFTLTKVAEMPFLGDHAVATSVAYNRVYERRFAKANEHQGVKLLGLSTSGPGELFMTRKPVAKLADLAGMKFRTGGGVVNDIASALGVIGLMKPPTEVFEILNSGVADGVFFTREAMLTFKVAPVIKHVTLIPGSLYNTSFALIMNEAKWNGLPAADQQAVARVSGENFARLAGRSYEDSDQKGLALLRAAGSSIITASPAFVKEIEKATAPVVDAWVKEAAAKGYDGRAVIEELRAEAKKVDVK